LISPDKIEEWIREVEERPASAALIIQYIANRLSELATREEELSAENIELLSGRRVEEYESRIANLEYQLELLKRQLGGDVILPVETPTGKPTPELISVVVYNPLGQIIRVEFEPAGMSTGARIGMLRGEPAPGEMRVSVLATSSQEELLIIFDSGRTVTLPAARLPLDEPENLDWLSAYLEEPRIKEELAGIIPIAKMPLFDTCVQASRRGYVKKIKISFFTSHLAEGYIGTGVKLPADRTFGLTFATKDDLFVMVSQEGFVFSMPAEQLPSAIEEVIHLGITDHIVSVFTAGQKPSLLFVTRSGKAVHRDVSWLEPATSFKTRGQPLLSKERREAGTRIAGAAPVGDGDWGAFLHGDGRLTAHLLSDLLASGSVLPGQTEGTIVSFSTYSVPIAKS